jgi:adenosine deaminase
MIDHNFPFIDLHRHLEGCIRLETVLDLSRKHGLSLPARDMDGLKQHLQITEPQPGVMAFIEKMHWRVRVLVDYEACYRAAYENVVDAHSEGLDYLELRFSPWYMAEPHGLDPEGIVEAVAGGIAAGCEQTGLAVKLIGILSRTYGPEVAAMELDSLLRHRDRLVGLDLAGDEANFPGELFVQHLRRARETGLRITIHAGEASGPESIWQALRDLGAERIGHAVRAVEDPALMDTLASRRTGIEANLTSNVQTSTVPDYPSHPLREFLERGLLATINSDDPGVSGIDLDYEYQVAAPAAGLSQEQIQAAQRNALEAAFLTTEEKGALLAKKAGDRS